MGSVKEASAPLWGVVLALWKEPSTSTSHFGDGRENMKAGSRESDLLFVALGRAEGFLAHPRG